MATRKKSAKAAPKRSRVEVRNTAKSNGDAPYGSQHGGTIAPAKGKLGVMIPGMGAVATTFVAGVEAIRKGLAKPIGSLTQMGTVRLGKRTEGRSPKINEVVPLSSLDDLVFGGWDIFDDDCYTAARTAGVIEPALLDKVRPELEKIRPWPAVFDQPRRRDRGHRRRKHRQSGAGPHHVEHPLRS